MAARSALNSGRDQAEDPCFFSGYEEEVTTPTVLLNGSSAMARVSVAGPRLAYPDQFNVCMESLKPLLQKQLNSFCMEVYDGECSMDGFYQPQLPSGRNGHFIASAMYKYPWYFLQMPETSTIRHFKSRAEDICALSYRDVLKYNDNLGTSVKKDDNVKYYCFLSSYISVLLERELCGRLCMCTRASNIFGLTISLLDIIQTAMGSLKTKRSLWWTAWEATRSAFGAVSVLS